METNCIVLGQEKRKSKPIEFLGIIGDGMTISNALFSPRDWANVELVSREYCMFDGEMVDLIFAYGNDRHNDCALYFGHWNDGFV